MTSPLLRLSVLPLLAAPAFAQFTLPSPTLVQRAAPRATWKTIPAAGINATGSTFRADNPGAASADRIYVFGGCLNNNTSTTVNDLYVFDPAVPSFTQVNDGTGVAPHARGRAAVAWNFSTGRLVVFGGDNRATGPLPADTLLNDTWEWDPNTNTWTDVTPISGSPSPRRWSSMTYEPLTGGMLLFGGDVGGGVVASDTWLFVGGAWTPLAPATTPPGRRQHSLMTRTNPEFNDVLMMGGEDQVGLAPEIYRHLDVWTWNGADWTKISDWDWGTSTGSFPASSQGQAAYDAVRKRVVMQGNNGIAANTAGHTIFLFGTSTYNGSPTNYTSEFDCVTNSWTLYANPTTGTLPYNNNDPVIGRISRHFTGFLASTGKVYKLCGQNGAVSGAKPVYNAYEYQADPIASTAAYGATCSGPGGALSLVADNAPWTERTFQATATGFGPFSLGFAMVSLGQLNPGAPLGVLPLPGPGAGCELGVASLDITAGLIPVAGAAQFFLSLPSAQIDPTLPGLNFYLQVAELDFSAGWVGTYTTNSLACEIGAL